MTEEDMVYDGVVIWFTNQFGFIGWKKDGVQQKDLFVHFSDLVADGFRSLKKDQKVRFKLGLNVRGQPKAVEVQVIE